MKIKFSKQINQKRTALAVSSIALTAVTLMMEGYTQRVVDAMTFQPLFFGGILMAYFFFNLVYRSDFDGTWQVNHWKSHYYDGFNHANRRFEKNKRAKRQNYL